MTRPPSMETSGSPKASKVPFYRRLSFRLAAGLFLTLLAFDRLSEPLYHAVFDWFDFEVDEDGVTFFESCTDWVPEEFENALLEGATPLANGSWQPSEDALERATATLAGRPLDFLWLSPDLEILAAPRSSQDLIGRNWRPDIAHPNAGEHASHCVPTLVPSHRDGVLAGWFAVTPELPPQMAESAPGALAESDGERTGDDSDATGEWQPVDPFEIDPELGAMFERMDRTAFWTGVGVHLCVALLLSALLSRWVTARLSRLTRQVAHGEPLTVGGTDEIAVLRDALDHARERVAGLVESLKQRDQQRSAWVAQVSHDLRTPLMALSACIERAHEARDPELRERTLNSARADVARICELSEDLLAAARVEAGTQRVRETLLPGELIDRAILELTPIAESRRIAIEAELDIDLPSIQGDGRHLMRVLENLLRNALRHARSRVQISAHSADDLLVVQVYDDGPGFAATTGEPSADPDSAGLGLRVARRILEQHGGHLETSDAQQGGALAMLRLPLVARAS